MNDARRAEILKNIKTIKTLFEAFKDLDKAVQWLRCRGHEFMAALATAGQVLVCAIGAAVGIKTAALVMSPST
jgi:hypothetical protein